MSQERPIHNRFIRSGHEAASDWNQPDLLKQVEEQRYPTQRALSKIIGNVFMQHVPQGASIYEVGAGQGYLKDLVPVEYHSDYISSDYNIANLIAGQKRRELTIERASATDLPLADNSKDCIVNLDAYDTLPDLQAALNEAQRVLKPGGKFMHFQVNYPGDDTVMFDHPDLIFFPPKLDELTGQSVMVGVKREDLIKGLHYIKTASFRKVIQDFLSDPTEAYLQAQIRKNPKLIRDLIYDLLDAMPIDKYVVPSLPDYFRTKLERTSMLAGLIVVESGFRGTSIRAPRSQIHLANPQANEFSSESNGSSRKSINSELNLSGSSDIIESASVLVFVAKKHQV